MKPIRWLCAVAMGLGMCSAQASVFDYSYTFGTGAVVSGTLSGTQSGNFVTGVTNVSVFLNGNPFSGNPNLYQPYIFLAGCCFVSGAGAVSFDGNLNNFIFSDAAPNTPAINTFYMNGTDKDFHFTGNQSPLRYATVITGSSYITDVTASTPGYPGANGHFNAAKWSLSAQAAVPAPGSVALVLLGLGLLGAARQRKPVPTFGV